MKDQGRLYLHGDPTEEDPNEYYCHYCDDFVRRGHFDTCDCREIYQRGWWRKRTHEYRYVQYRRELLPRCHRYKDDPNNLFRTGTVKEQKLPKLEKSDRYLPYGYAKKTPEVA